MVKFGKNKLKLLNKTSKAQKNESKISGKITKKKTQVAQSQALTNKKASVLKELTSTSSDLVELKSEVKKQIRFAKSATEDRRPPQPKQKPVEKQKKRQKTQINDTKMLLKLMKKK